LAIILKIASYEYDRCFLGIGKFFQWSFKFMKALGGGPNYFFWLIIIVLIVVWLRMQTNLIKKQRKKTPFYKI